MSAHLQGLDGVGDGSSLGVEVLGSTVEVVVSGRVGWAGTTWTVGWAGLERDRVVFTASAVFWAACEAL